MSDGKKWEIDHPDGAPTFVEDWPPDVDMELYPALKEWLTAQPGRRMEVGAGKHMAIAVQLVDGGKPMYGFQGGDRELILEALDQCMHSRLMRQADAAG